MEVKYREVPKVEKEYYYVASDGTEFSNRWDCESYERRLGYNGIAVIETAIDGLYDYDDDASMTMYHIMTKEDWNILVERVWFHNNFGTQYLGPGYYIAKYCDGGDCSRESYYIYTMDKYIDDVNEEIKRLFNNKNSIEEAKDEIIRYERDEII